MAEAERDKAPSGLASRLANFTKVLIIQMCIAIASVSVAWKAEPFMPNTLESGFDFRMSIAFLCVIYLTSLVLLFVRMAKGFKVDRERLSKKELIDMYSFMPILAMVMSIISIMTVPFERAIPFWLILSAETGSALPILIWFLFFSSFVFIVRRKAKTKDSASVGEATTEQAEAESPRLRDLPAAVWTNRRVCALFLILFAVEVYAAAVLPAARDTCETISCQSSAARKLSPAVEMRLWAEKWAISLGLDPDVVQRWLGAPRSAARGQKGGDDAELEAIRQEIERRSRLTPAERDREEAQRKARKACVGQGTDDETCSRRFPIIDASSLMPPAGKP